MLARAEADDFRNRRILALQLMDLKHDGDFLSGSVPMLLDQHIVASLLDGQQFGTAHIIAATED